MAYLHTRIGVKPSANAGGFLFLPPENPQGWEQHEDGIRGRRFPDYFWKADNLWGAGTFLHRGADERRHGMWRPKDGHNFYEHDASRRLAYIGGNCYSWAGMPADDMATLRTRLQELADSKLPKGFYTANTFVAQGRLTPELLDTMAAGLDSLKPFVEKGVLVWSPLTRTAERWKREYGGKPFQYECAPK
ncbi:MAG: hypothetical protein HY235_10580 [Acidobacteria bacterium]|nr:hypothetical protein [Acidobacteriota bacterium]